MKMVRTIDVTRGAVQFDGRGHRSPQTMLLLDERDHYLREAALLHCGGMSDRAAASFLRTRLVRYREGRWQRDRSEDQCPPRLAGLVEALMWCVLKCRDHAPSEMTIRRALGFS